MSQLLEFICWMFIICLNVSLHYRQTSPNLGIFLALLIVLSPCTQHGDQLLVGVQHVSFVKDVETGFSLHSLSHHNLDLKIAFKYYMCKETSFKIAASLLKKNQ